MNFNCFPLILIILSVKSSFSENYDLMDINSLCPSFKLRNDGQMSESLHFVPLNKDLFDEAAKINNSWSIQDLQEHESPIHCVIRIAPITSTSVTNNGLIAAIQKLHFRRDSNGDCIDYLIINYGNNKSSGKICDKIDRGANPVKTFVGKEIIFTLHLENINGSFNSGLTSLSLLIVFTKFEDCGSLFTFSCFNNRSGCIPKKFFRDGIINCVMPECRDEQSCFDNVVLKALDTSNIAISAITSFIFTAVGVGTCLWMCWKYKECFQECSNTSNPPNPAQITGNIELQTGENNQTAESPPPLDKDLPPSYDTLFPVPQSTER